MSPLQAKQALLLYRPGTSDAEDPEIAEALDLARRDAELGRWFEEHCAFQKSLRTGFHELEVPADGKSRIFELQRHRAAEQLALARARWRRPVYWAAAAVVALLIGLSLTWFKPHVPDRFVNFQARMVRTVLREYRMDIRTNDMNQVRKYLAVKGAPADYALPPGLGPLQVTGGGALRWRNNPVTMVCFNRGDNQMLFLFVLDHAAIKDPPPAAPQLTKVNHMLAASWTEGGKSYILAGPEEADFVRKYL